MKFRLLTSVFLSISSLSFTLETLLIEKGFLYEMYGSQEEIPLSELQAGREMYFEAYLNPCLHEGIPLMAMQIDETRFHSYEEFISDMFQRDFESYQFPGDTSRLYIQVRRIQDGKIIGICAILMKAPHSYYIDHIGVHKDFRRQKIGSTLIEQALKAIPDYIDISLDTRVFNKSAQFFYEKLGFEKVEVHPYAQKQSIYCHYVFMKDSYMNSVSAQMQFLSALVDKNFPK
ncbi:MAG: GNAT family N-acetyltransferase [Verrucomicrobia bacterium]|nr:GNAT family N-acetyltransferase [Verrucomicrobiota bacterium]